MHRLISLTLALMGSDDLNLRVLATSSEDPKERKSAGKVLRLLQRGRHWVLVVLLLGNVVGHVQLPCGLSRLHPFAFERVQRQP